MSTTKTTNADGSSTNTGAGATATTDTNHYHDWEIAWAVRRMDGSMSWIPNATDFEDTEYLDITESRICGRIGDRDTLLGMAGIKTPTEWIIDAIQSFVDDLGGRTRTANLRRLRQYMYPYCETNPKGRGFGCRDVIPQTTNNDSEYPAEREVIDSWEYPRISISVMSHIVADFAEHEGPYGPDGSIDVEYWSKAHTNVYTFTVVENATHNTQ